MKNLIKKIESKLYIFGIFIALKLGIYKIRFVRKDMYSNGEGHWEFKTYGTWMSQVHWVFTNEFNFNQAKEKFIEYLKQEYYISSKTKKLLKEYNKELNEFCDNFDGSLKDYLKAPNPATEKYKKLISKLRW